MNTPTIKNSRLWQRIIAPFVEPYARYQYSMQLHALRLGVAVVIALLFNLIMNIPHGEWTAITVFVILGLLQYQGAIYTKAFERVLGTLYGIALGALLLWLNQHILSGLPIIYYSLVGLCSGMIGYYAVKKLGYVGLLTGITMCMLISDSQNIGIDGFMRAMNVLAGTLIAVLATVLLPLKSTLMWRFLLAKNLQACSNIYQGVHEHIEKPLPNLNHGKASHYIAETLQADDIPANSRQRPFDTPLSTPVSSSLTQELRQINSRLLAVRSHIAATAKESGIDTEMLEKIQHIHRNLIGTIDLLLAAAPMLATLPLDDDNHQLLVHYQRELNHAMQHMAAVLRSPSDEVFRPITRIQVSEYPSVQAMSFEWQGYFWLTQTLQAQLQTLSDLLQQTKPQWYKASGLRYQRRESRRVLDQG